MELEKIKELIRLVELSKFDEFSYTEGVNSISFKKNSQNTGMPIIEPHETGVERPDNKDDDDFEYILSPMVGTYYNSPAPGSPAYVKVGDTINQGDTLCIIEAMKLMNEIECPYEAEIVSIVVSNEQKVEYGQPLFKIKKL